MPATVLLGQVCTVILFLYLLVILSFLGWFESLLFLHAAKLKSAKFKLLV